MNVDDIKTAEAQRNLYISAAVVTALSRTIFDINSAAGWWSDLKTGQSIRETRNVGEVLMLIVSEVSEAMEAHRKDLKDDKLPHRSGLEVELADAVIRIFDLCGAKKLDIGAAIIEKLLYNMTREDHKIENRTKDGGKKY
jgi:NTP pyrophosphatase (non-canonical NTP hydrolase)